jgi:hypothetical protein
MSGLPGLNYPAFHNATTYLRELGYQVENPAENPAPACGSWAGYMRMAIAQLVQCDEIHMLRGWKESKGAKLEHEIAQQLGLLVSGASS